MGALLLPLVATKALVSHCASRCVSQHLERSRKVARACAASSRWLQLELATALDQIVLSCAELHSSVLSCVAPSTLGTQWQVC